MHKVLFYTTRRGEAPVSQFVASLDKKSTQKVMATIMFLEEKGPRLSRPYAAHIRGPLRELRIRFGRHSIRILFFSQEEKQIVLLHGFLKKSQKLSERDMALAENRMKDWIHREGNQ